jgi:uncharacterized protein (DUF885 family)
MPATRQFYGVGLFPNGTEYYTALLRWYLSVDLTPTEVHQIGLKELQRIHQQLINVSH